MLHCLAGPDESALPLHAVAPGQLEALSRRLRAAATACRRLGSGVAAEHPGIAVRPVTAGGSL